MADTDLLQSLERLERAVATLQASIETAQAREPANQPDNVLRSEVRAVIEELDRMIAVRHG
jgi:hypothetical protein